MLLIKTVKIDTHENKYPWQLDKELNAILNELQCDGKKIKKLIDVSRRNDRSVSILIMYEDPNIVAIKNDE